MAPSYLCGPHTLMAPRYLCGPHTLLAPGYLCGPHTLTGRYTALPQLRLAFSRHK